jgi:hypothetical protein
VKIFSALALFAFTVSGLAQETAYQALTTVGKIKGEAYLDNLLYLEGREGGSQPGNWRLIFEDPASRAGFREIEVQNGQIVSQRAPLKSSFGDSGRINLDRLQLDSDGAFTVAQREAARQRVRFAKANYYLQASGDAGAPTWRVELVDASGEVVQSMQVSAADGRVVGAGQRQVQPSQDGDYVVEETTEETVVTRSVADQPDREDDSTELKIHRSAVRTGRTIKNTFKQIGGSFQEVFTGRRTVDRDLEGE